MDVLTPQQRRLNMRRIRGRDTKPEMLLRCGLHACGLRYRLHARELPGRPDIVFPKYRAVIFANGCFWHGHNCSLFKMPSTRRHFWEAKISANKQRDHRALKMLAAQDWRVLVVWECALKGSRRLPLARVIDQCASFLRSQQTSLEISEKPDKS